MFPITIIKIVYIYIATNNKFCSISKKQIKDGF
jgi:hypothetical protein